MDSGLKWLIGAACVVAIAAGAVYLYGQYSSYSARVETQDRVARVRAELFRYAGADEGDIALVRGFCSRTNDNLSAGTISKEPGEQLVRNCRALGYL
jgi:hypothetical protein